MYIMLNRISDTVAYTTLFVATVQYRDENNISYAEIRPLLDLRISPSLRKSVWL